MKRIVSVLLALIMLAVVMLSLYVPASAETLRIRKIVSIVCDDSGSMKTDDRWSYANYALQAFCGMLNSDDELYITYLNKRTVTEADLSAKGIQSTVDTIKNTACSSSTTPFGKVKDAFNVLKNVKDDNPNTQYWLVVISDGEFDGVTSNNDTQQQKDEKVRNFLNNECATFINTKMPNGTTPKITYLGIGNVAVPDPVEGRIFPYRAADATGIKTEMANMADRVSGRRRLNEGDITLVGNNTLRVSSSVPLSSIVIFTQGDGISFDKATCKGQSIPKNREAHLSYSNSNLKGDAYLLGGSGDIIPAGEYEFKLESDKKINLDDDIVILFEPALEMRMKVSLNGKEISDFSELDQASEGDMISISCKIYEMGTNNVVAVNDMPEGTTYEISVYENEKKVKTATGKEMLLDEYELKNVPTRIEAVLTLEGFKPIVNRYEFTPIKFVSAPVYTVVADQTPRSIKYTDLSSNKDMALYFTVYRDGTAIKDKAEIEALKPVITSAGKQLSFTYDAGGRIAVVPTSAVISDLTKETCDITVKCTLEGEEAKKASDEANYTVILPKYEVVAEQTAQSIKYVDLASNEDLAIYFTVYCDGNAIKDKAEIEALKPVLTSSDGKQLSFTYDGDGRITVVPTSTAVSDLTKDKTDVTVTCALESDIAKKASVKASFTVIFSKYELVTEQTAQSIRYTDLASNKDFAIYFTLYRDGDAVKDKTEIEALKPVLTSSDGKQLSFTYGGDGRIVYIPTSAEIPSQHDGAFRVKVTCTLEGEAAGGASGSAEYTVTLAKYTVIPTNAAQSVVKTEWFENTTSVSFYILKQDGDEEPVRLIGDEVEAGIVGIILDGKHTDLLTDVTVAPDGTITVTPHSEKPYGLNFWNWGINGFRYVFQEGSDVTVTVDHAYGQASATIDVVGEDLLYLIFNVFLPFLEKFSVAAFVLWWIHCIVDKPKFNPNTSIYYGNIQKSKDGDLHIHKILSFEELPLGEENNFLYIIKPTMTPKRVQVYEGLEISPTASGAIICHGPIWYRGEITPKDYGVRFGHPDEVVKYIDDSKAQCLKIKRIESDFNTNVQPVSTIDGPDPTQYYICIDGSYESNKAVQIDNGTIFAYTYSSNN